MPAPGDYDDGEIGGMIGWQGKPKYWKKTCPSAVLSTKNSTCCPDANPCRCGGKPVTNRYGTAKYIIHEYIWYIIVNDNDVQVYNCCFRVISRFLSCVTDVQPN
jgi:hypothetical protein